MQTPSTALVIGGGVIGMNVALALQERGVSTTVLDAPSSARPASWGNAGHIAVEQVTPMASWSAIRALPRRLLAVGGPVSLPLGEIAAWLPFGARLVRAAAPGRFAEGMAALKALMAEAMPAWRRRVAAIGAANLLLEDGHVVAWESAETAAAGRAAWAAADKGTARFRDASPEERVWLEQVAPGKVVDAIRFIGTGRISDPDDLAEALEAAFLAAGGTRKAAFATLGAATLAQADIVVVAAGVRSGELLRGVGHHVPMIAERGYHIQSTAAAWPEGLGPVVFEDRSLFLAPFRSGLRATSFVEFASPDAPADPAKWARLRRHVRALGLPLSAPESEWMGARPTLPDYLPAIGRSGRAPNLFYAFGHQHLGLTLGPLTGELVAALVTEGRAGMDLSAFSLDRFD